MATRIKLQEFIALSGESKLTVKERTGKSLRTIYNWLEGIYSQSEMVSVEVLIDYDARSNKILEVTKVRTEILYSAGVDRIVHETQVAKL